MSERDVLALDALPVCIGPCPTPTNPPGVPTVLPLRLSVNDRLGRLQLAFDPAILGAMERVYAMGMAIGVPSDNSDLGRPYVDDFIAYLERHVHPPGRLLEIGAGVGFMSSVLQRRGWQVDSLEPGVGFEAHWKRHGVQVVPESFPSRHAAGPYAVIVLYTVLEHVRDTATFLSEVRDHLAPDGCVVLGVPDCTDEIAAGDPSILLHEHWHYFTRRSLLRTLAEGGLSGEVTSSTFGRCWYAAVRPVPGVGASTVLDGDEVDLAALEAFGTRATALRAQFQRAVHEAQSSGTVGIYCPSRALNLLRLDGPAVRFFDDAPWIQGCFYPPFPYPVESRAAFLASPPDTVFVMSRTFGDRLCRELVEVAPRTRFVPLSALALAGGTNV